MIDVKSIDPEKNTEIYLWHLIKQKRSTEADSRRIVMTAVTGAYRGRRTGVL